MNAYTEHAHYGFRIIMHAQENPYEPKASGCWSFMMSKRVDVLNIVISGTNVPPTVHFTQWTANQKKAVSFKGEKQQQLVSGKQAK